MIQETKVSNQEVKTQKKIEGTAMDSIGASGDIYMLWNKWKWELVHKKINNYWVRTDLKNKKTNEEYTVIDIYSPNHYRDKAMCWESVKEEAQEDPRRNIVIGGDLNLVRHIDEKLGGNYFSDPSRATLEDIIEAHKLLDIPPSNGRFTWSNKRSGAHNIKERLDRILIQENIVAAFPTIKSRIVHASTFDHKPVVLILDRLENLGPIPFKYKKLWDSKEDFGKLVNESWETPVLGSLHYVWETKFKKLRSNLKAWGRENALKEKNKKIELQKKLENWSKEKENLQHIEQEHALEKEIFLELYKQNRQVEEEIRQKTRCLWLKVGDKNTAFFHNNLKIRRVGNQIYKIQVEGQEIKEMEEIKKTAHNY